MGGLLGQLNIPYQPDPTAVAEQIAKLRGRSQAQGLFGQLNIPTPPIDSDVMRAMKDLAAKRFSTSRALVPMPGSSVVPYGGQAGGELAGFVPPAAPMARTLGQAAGSARYGLPELPQALAGAGGGGGGYVPPMGGFTGAAGEAAGGGGGLFGAAGAAEAAAPLALNAGTVGGIAGRFLVNPGASGLARFINPAMLNTEGGIGLRAVGGRLLGYGGLGILAAQGINAAVPGDPHYQSTLSKAAIGAGIGAGIGSVVPGIGTAVGALGGGAIGALSSLWDKDKAPKSQKQRNKLMEQLEATNLDPETKSAIATQYRTLYQLADTEEERQAAFDAAKEQLIAAIPEAAKLKGDQDTMLASQAMLQQFLRPSVQNMASTARNQQTLLNQYAGALPENMQAPARIGAGQRVADANRTAAAYANQMASIPQITAMQLANQRAQAAPAAGTTDLQALLAGG